MRLAFSFLHAHQRFSSFTAELFNSMTANNLFTAQHVQSGRMCVRCGTKNRSDCPSVRLNMAGARPPIFSRAHIHSKHIQTHAARTMMFKVFFLLFFFLFQSFQVEINFCNFHFTLHLHSVHTTTTLTHTAYTPRKRRRRRRFNKINGEVIQVVYISFLAISEYKLAHETIIYYDRRKKKNRHETNKKERRNSTSVCSPFHSFDRQVNRRLCKYRKLE